MTSFMLENAYLNYMMQVVDDTTKLVTSDAVVVDENSNLRDLYGTTVELKSAGAVARKIEQDLPGYKTSIRVTARHDTTHPHPTWSAWRLSPGPGLA